MRRQRGIALAAFILVVVALVGAFILSQTLSRSGKQLDTSSRMTAAFKNIDDALVRFIQLNKRLPCPAPGASSTGVEGAADASGTCPSATAPGVIPWVTLGLPPSAAIDEWGRLISYRVFDGATGFTRADGMNVDKCLDADVTAVYTLAALQCNSATYENTRSDFFNNKGLTVNDLGNVKQQIAYVLISHGPSGLGAFLPGSASAMAAPVAGSSEQLNAQASGTYWILPLTDSSIGVDQVGHFDDVVSYSSASSVVIAARSGGRPWPLVAAFNAPPGSISAGSTQRFGPLAVSAFATTVPQRICVVSPPDAIGPCTAPGVDDHLTTADGEGLMFDFRVPRRYLRLVLSDFDSTLNAEMALVTFYDGTTQIGQQTITACRSGSSAKGNFAFDASTLFPGKRFTRVSVTALNRNGISTSSDFLVSSIAGCAVIDTSYPDCQPPSRNVTDDCSYF